MVNMKEDFINSEKCRPGDIWQLGDHRLMVGDASSPEDMKALMGGEVADMVINDPPYGMSKEGKGVLGDNQNADALLDFNRRWVPLSFGAMKRTGAWYCFGNDKSIMDIYAFILRPMIQRKEITFKCLLTWDKMGAPGVNSPYMRTYAAGDEKCLFCVGGLDYIGNNAPDYYEGFDEIRLYLRGEKEKLPSEMKIDEILGNHMGRHYFLRSQWVLPTEEAYRKLQEAGKPYGAFSKSYEELKGRYDELLGREQTDDKQKKAARLSYFDNTQEAVTTVWHVAPASKKERQGCGRHPTIKPQKILQRAVKFSSRPGEIVLDMFAGSGSTLIACEATGRKCYTMEKSPHWAEVAISRWEHQTGGQGILLKEGKQNGREDR